MVTITHILEAIVIKDVQVRLLRATSLEAYAYGYGCTKIKHFPQSMYLPLLYNSFQTIELDMRDEHGEALLFDGETFTVVLHFKRRE